MKKSLVIIMAILMIGAGVYGALISQGWGKKYTASTTVQRVALGDYITQFDARAHQVSVLNSGGASEELYFSINTTLAQASNLMVTATNCLIIPGGRAMNIPVDYNVQSICFRAAAGTFTVYINAL